MPETTTSARPDAGEPPPLIPTTLTDYSNISFPLHLLRSQVIPPAPNTSKSAVDWLPEFAGCAWIAYGASSLFVITHCPSPLSPEETEVGPFFQQVIEPSPGKLDEDVNAVAWCPSRPIDGTVAFGLGNSVRLYAPEVEYAARGSLHWRHKVSLSQSFVVEAIEWTGSGDGLITAGTEVVLWKRKANSWQVTYKVSAEFPQCMVSATWSIDGPVAAAAVANSLTYPCTRNNSATSVLSSKENAQVIVCQHDGRSSFIESGLLHPQPVSMVQWRPFAQPWSKKNRMHSRRDVLLTCCLDGVVRLWSEVDSIRDKKTSKDNDDMKSLGRSYHVVAVIEINQSLKSMLAIDTFVSWAADIHSAFHLDDGNPLCHSEICDYNSIGHCEWLVSLGPGQSLTFWAIYCLDDVSPLRSPRVSLWKKYVLEDSNERNFGNAAPSHSCSLPFLIKSVVSRNKAFSPPITCSLLTLSPNNSVSWLCLDNIGSENQVTRLSSLPHNEEISTCAVYQVRSPSGHTGAMLQISVHPCIHEVELAVSLDSDSCLCFWSTSSMTSICNFGLESLYNPAWKLLDRIVSQDSSNPVVYANLAWVPHVFNGDLFLFMGHEEGIDCFMVRITGLNEQFCCCKAFTISFSGHFPRDHCYSIFTKSFTSVCTTSCFNKFTLLAIWTSEFQVLSWEIIMNSDDSSQATCNCILDGGKAIPYDFIFMNTYAGRTYHIKVDLCSSDFPSFNCSPDKITSFAVSSSYFVPSVQQLTGTEVCKTSSPLYDIVTGYSDGTVRMWRFLRPALSTENMDMKSMPWELVGTLTTHEGPVVSVALSNCSTKLAAVCMTGPNHSLVLQIWRSMYLVSGGCFSLEEKICLNEPVITLNWQTLGNGQLLLAICMKNEVRIYLQKRIANPIMEEWDKNVEMLNYFCVAVCCTKCIIKGFFWGPKVTLVLVHDKHFSLYSHWSSTEETGSRRSALEELKEYNSANIAAKTNEDLDECVKPAVTINSCTNDKKLSNSKSGEQFGADNGIQLCSFLRVVDSICEPVAVFHPNALLLHLISGKWKRAYLAVQHLVKYLCSRDTSNGDTSNGDTSNGNVEENKVGKSHPLAPEISLAEYFERDVPATSNYEGIAWGSDFSNRMFDKLEGNLIHETGGSSLFNSSVSISGPTFKLSETRRYINIIEKSHDIPSLTDLERTQFLAVVHLLDECINPSFFSTYESFDEPARRFWISVRFKNLIFGRKVGKLVAPDDLKAETWMIAWAFQSDCQEGLYNSVLSPESSWLEMNNMGVGYWCTNVTHLRQKMEKLARAKYLFKRDPKDCTLLYLALNRLQVLLGLFKISKDEKDKPLEEKNKAAALKNAYVLLGRHQLELAAAFFLLGGDPYSAVTICAKNLADEQLALVICRLVEGYGGSLERKLISNVLLPNAIDKGDHWLSSIFEWTLGNYLQSYTNLMDSSLDSAIDSMGALKIHAVSFDPSIGQYCSTLASRNSLRSSVGEQMSAVLSKWAILETGNAFIRCGLPLEGLECMSLSSFSNLESKDQIGSLVGENNTTWNTSLKMITCGRDNWLLIDVASHLEYNNRLNVAMRYITKLVGGHPLWQESNLLSSAMPLNRINIHLFNSQLDGFNAKIKTSISLLQQMHSLKSSDIINMMLSFANSYELMFLGFKVLREFFSGEDMDDNPHSIDRFDLCPIKLNMFLKACKEICYSVARYIPYLNITGILPFISERYQFNQDICKSSQLYSSYCFLQGLDCLLKHLRYFLKLCSPSIFEAESCFKTLLVLDHLELSLHFAAAWSERNLKELTLMVHPVVNYLSGKLSFQEATGGEMQNLLVQTSGAVQHLYESYLRTAPREVRHDENDLSVVPLEEGRWKLVGASLWKKLHDFSRHQLRMSMTVITEDGKNIKKQIEALPFFSSESLVTGLASIFSVLNKQHTSWILQKVENGFPFDTLFNLEGSTETSYLPYSLSQGHGVSELTVTESWVFLLGVLSEASINLEETSSNPCKEISRFLLSRQKDFGFWNGIKGDSLTGSEGQNGVNYDVDFPRTSSSENEALQLVKGQDSSQEMAVDAGIKDWAFFQEASYFDMPKEVYKRSGELIEAICFNCFDEKQVSLATNKQGIKSINLDFEGTPTERAKYLWSDYEWPHDGWAGSESTPVPTFVSQGIGLGTRKGAHLGLGGATVGSISLARPGRDLTGGGAFGIPGYAGMGASGLGWGELEDFEFIDPPATSDNISARTLCSHPSKSLFLVGSRNTHVYLWEFGKDRAIATYGVLPAANVPPPYALASISALRFDRYGQRFSTAAIDGTICTWQLEVGGRSNVHPTESSLCFNNHATDVTYITASGSTIAATGYNKNNANAIIWDTLAPPTSSQASIICHEGGARSLSVLDNGSGGGSVSPIIITGGKNGDVSLHDFRYIATGRTKRHKHSSLKGSMQDTKIRVAKSGENDNGLLWHIPKAHLGSIARISAIPNTSLFLTGGSDGDVKLWDANKSKLIFHWQKLHEKHTFLQPSSRGFSGVVRAAAVTDVQVLSHGFLSCGGDGTVKRVQLIRSP